MRKEQSKNKTTQKAKTKKLRVKDLNQKAEGPKGGVENTKHPAKVTVPDLK